MVLNTLFLIKFNNTTIIWPQLTFITPLTKELNHMTQAQKWANEAMHLKNENVDLQLLNEKLLSALESLMTTALEEHQSWASGEVYDSEDEDCFERAWADATIAIKAAKDA